jgi:hypothetical protein
MLILMLAIGLGFLRRRDFSADSTQGTAEIPAGEKAKADDGFGPIPTVERPDDSFQTAVPASVSPSEDASDAMKNLTARMSRETAGLEVITHADGRRSVDLGGRFLHMSAAVTGADGKTEVRCFSSASDLNAGKPSPEAPQRPPHVR